MPLAEFEPTTSAGERPQTYDLDRAATGISSVEYIKYIHSVLCRKNTETKPKEFINICILLSIQFTFF